VRDRTLQHAVLSAYENLLMKHRYPWAVLYLEVPPEFVDVNVHPTKSEVRFANGSLVHELVRESVRQVLQGERGVVGDGDGDRGALPLAPQNPHPQVASNLFQTPLPNWERGPVFPEIMKGEGVRILGQAHGTYLLCETDDKLILIDQHAAHERIGFEKLHAQY